MTMMMMIIIIVTGPLSNTMLLRATQVSLPNGISFRPTALAGCTSVTELMRDLILSFRPSARLAQL